MKVKELVELLQKADPDLDVRYSMMAWSEYGECIEHEGDLDNDDIVITDSYVELFVSP